MGNSRRFNPSRRNEVATLKQRLKRAEQDAAYYRQLAMGLASQLEELQWPTPPDLDAWVESVLPDMDEDERAQWEAMSESERDEFVSQLGQRIAAAETLLQPAAEVPEPQQ